MWFRRRENKSGEEAKLALADATQQLERVKRRDAEVRKVVADHKRLQDTNHFAEQLEGIILGIGGSAG